MVKKKLCLLYLLMLFQEQGTGEEGITYGRFKLNVGAIVVIDLGAFLLPSKGTVSCLWVKS